MGTFQVPASRSSFDECQKKSPLLGEMTDSRLLESLCSRACSRNMEFAVVTRTMATTSFCSSLRAFMFNFFENHCLYCGTNVWLSPWTRRWPCEEDHTSPTLWPQAIKKIRIWRGECQVRVCSVSAGRIAGLFRVELSRSDSAGRSSGPRPLFAIETDR